MLYAASLALPSVAPFNPRFSDTVYPGWDAFHVGWRALFAFEPADLDWWVLAGAWVANPLIWLATAATFAGQRRVCRIVAAGAVALCLPILWQYGGMVANQPGYWVWIMSAGVLLAGSYFRWIGAAPSAADDRNLQTDNNAM